MHVVALGLMLPGILTCYYLLPGGRDYDTHRSGWRARTLLQADEEIIDVHDTEFMVGYVLGWISAVIYFFALPPQIIKNVSIVITNKENE